MRPPKFYTMYCPDTYCKAAIRLPLTWRTDDRGRSVVVNIDPTPMRDHVRQVHGAEEQHEPTEEKP